MKEAREKIRSIVDDIQNEKEAREKICSIVDDIQNENDRIYVYLKNGLIPKCEKSFYNKKIKSNNMAILKLMQAVLYLDESEEY